MGEYVALEETVPNETGTKETAKVTPESLDVEAEPNKSPFRLWLMRIIFVSTFFLGFADIFSDYVLITAAFLQAPILTPLEMNISSWLGGGVTEVEVGSREKNYSTTIRCEGRWGYLNGSFDGFEIANCEFCPDGCYPNCPISFIHPPTAAYYYCGDCYGDYWSKDDMSRRTYKCSLQSNLGWNIALIAITIGAEIFGSVVGCTSRKFPSMNAAKMSVVGLVWLFWCFVTRAEFRQFVWNKPLPPEKYEIGFSAFGVVKGFVSLLLAYNLVSAFGMRNIFLSPFSTNLLVSGITSLLSLLMGTHGLRALLIDFALAKENYRVLWLQGVYVLGLTMGIVPIFVFAWIVWTDQRSRMWALVFCVWILGTVPCVPKIKAIGLKLLALSALLFVAVVATPVLLVVNYAVLA